MDSIIAASVIAAGLSIGLSAIGPGIGQVTLLVKLLKVLLVNLKQKRWWYYFKAFMEVNYLRSSCSVSIIIR
jgi:F0F1-type ATP synthase membrane subunit c/vacuolar-type H+-ATPase subunit K